MASTTDSTRPDTKLATSSTTMSSDQDIITTTITTITTTKAQKAAEAMTQLLGQSIKCTLDDGRIATGTFVCMDRLKNLILTNVEEERWIDTSDYSTTNDSKILARRNLSQAMIPGIHLRKVEIEKSTYTEKVESILKVVAAKS